MNETQPSVLQQLLSSRLVVIGIGLLIVGILVVGSYFLFFRSAPKAALEPIPEGAVYSQNSITVKLKKEYAPAPTGQNPNWDSLYTRLQTLGVVGYEKVFETDSEDLQYHYSLQLSENASVAQIREEIYKLDAIESAEPDYILTTQATVNDPYYPDMWHFPKIQMENAWNIQTGSSTVRVAVVDTGIDYAHEDFVGRTIIKGKDVSTCDSTLDQLKAAGGNCSQPKAPDTDPMDTNGHGTHVAGTIGAVANNGIGVAGINHEVTLIGIKVLGRGGAGGIPDIANGIIDAADRGAKIINMSLGGEGSCAPNSAIRSSVEYAQKKGALVVVAAGNNAIDASRIAPANCPGVFVIGATGPNDERSSYSNFGSLVSLSAPGGNKTTSACRAAECVTSTWQNNAYISIVGTSMATPHVAGVAALVLAQNPTFTAEQLRTCLLSSADPISTDRPIGGKRLNAYNALNACSESNTPPSVTTTQTSVTPSVTVSPSASPNSQSEYFIKGKVYDDLNKNGNQDANEGNLSGIVIEIIGPTRQTATTGGNGEYSFMNIAPGNYRVVARAGTKVVVENRFVLNNQTPSMQLESPIMFPPETTVPQTTPGVNVVSGTPSPTAAPLFTCREKTTNREVNNRSIQVKYLECTPK